MICNAQQNTAGVIFYNVENLFDTIDNQMTLDDEFTPQSEKMWDSERYIRKLNNLSKVIVSSSVDFPVLIGLCEVENKDVVKDLAQKTDLKAGHYGIIHFDSPDPRGIDVALMYSKDYFKPIDYAPLNIVLPDTSTKLTRDILYVKGLLEMNNQKQEIHIFINHWPSRIKGEEFTAPNRAAAASVLKHTIDSINAKNTAANILIMGDFNDTPYDKSISQILAAKEPTAKKTDECLINLSSEKQKNNEGSYNYQGNWQALDQIIVSEGMMEPGSALTVKPNTLKYIKNDWMLYMNTKYGASPNKTYSGNKYYGGYSDHLPVYVELILQ